MKLYNSTNIADMLGITVSSFSIWIKNNKNILSNFEKMQVKKGKFVYYQPTLVKEILEARGKEIPESLLNDIQEYEITKTRTKIQKYYNITSANEALDLIAKLRYKSEALEKKNIELTAKIEVLNEEVSRISFMYKQLLNKIEIRPEGSKLIVENKYNPESFDFNDAFNDEDDYEPIPWVKDTEDKE